MAEKYKLKFQMCNTTKLFLNFTISTLFIFYNTLLSQSNNLEPLSKVNTSEYSSIQVKSNNEFSIYCFPHNGKRNKIYTNCLVYTNGPIQGYNIIKSSLKKYNIETILFSDLFTQNKKYKAEEIKHILELNNINLILKIGFNSDYYDSGFQTLINHFGKMDSKVIHNKAIQLYFDFYDMKWDSIPFLKTACIGYTGRNELKLYNEFTSILFRYIFKTNLMIYEESKEKPQFFFNTRLEGILKTDIINSRSSFTIKKYGPTKDIDNELSNKLISNNYIISNSDESDYIFYYYYGDIQLEGLNKKGFLVKIVDKNLNEICSFKRLIKKESIDSLLNELIENWK